jgi:hypothetical protein
MVGAAILHHFSALMLPVFHCFALPPADNDRT